MLPYRFFSKPMGHFDLWASQLSYFAVAISLNFSAESAGIHARFGYWEVGFSWTRQLDYEF